MTHRPHPGAVAEDTAATGTADAPAARGTVSAVVYSRDEAPLLPACLGALTGFDDVLVCDMQSTDATQAVAAQFGARTVQVPDARVVEQVRQDGLDAALGDWVLFVDADEIVPPGFAEHVRSMIAAADADGTGAFRLRYTNVAFGRTLEHTLTGSAKYALLRRAATRYPEVGRAHVPPAIDGSLRDAPADVPSILHLNFRGAEQTIEKTLRYARDVADEPALLSPLGLLRELARATVLHGTWRDGRAGVAVSTAVVVGRWYGALLAADAAGTLDQPLGARDQRVLGAVARVQRAYLRVKRAGGRLLPARPRAGALS